MAGEEQFEQLPVRVWFLCYEEKTTKVHTVELWKCGPFEKRDVPTALQALFRERPSTDLCYICRHDPDIAVAERAVLRQTGIAKLPWVLMLCVNETKREAKRKAGEN